MTPGVAAKPKSNSSGNFFAIVGSDEGQVREQALRLYQHLTGGNDDGFTHETIDGTSDNSDSAYEICASTVQALLTLPMFGGDKVVWLRNANFLGDTTTGRAQRTEDGRPHNDRDKGQGEADSHVHANENGLHERLNHVRGGI